MAVCPVCKRTFIPSRIQIARQREGKKIYCSERCYRKAKTKSATKVDDIYNKCVEVIEERIKSKRYIETMKVVLDSAFSFFDIQELYKHAKGGDAVSIIARAIVQSICDMENIGMKFISNDKVETKTVKVAKKQLNLKILPDFEKILHNQIEIICDALNLPIREYLHNYAGKVLDGLKKEGVYGSPVVTGAAVIYFLSQYWASKYSDELLVTQNEVAEFFGVSTTALRRNLRDLDEVFREVVFRKRRG